jgi:hypothetical protein
VPINTTRSVSDLAPADLERLTNAWESALQVDDLGCGSFVRRKEVVAAWEVAGDAAEEILTPWCGLFAGRQDTLIEAQAPSKHFYAGMNSEGAT